jgi:hypothetical protein
MSESRVATLSHIKLNNGDDLVAYAIVAEDRKSVTIEDPMQCIIDPDHGFFAKNWLMLSESKKLIIPSSKILAFGKASETAIKYYEEFKNKLDGKQDLYTEEDSYVEDLEELFTNLLESKKNTKH